MTGTGATRKLTMTVPMIRESTAAAAARRRVAQNPWRSSPEFSKSGVRSNIAHLFHGVPRESGHAGASPGGTRPHGDAPARRIGTADLPRPGRTGPGDRAGGSGGAPVSGAALHLRDGLDELQPRAGEVLLEVLAGGAVGVHLGDGLVDGLAGLGVALLHADAVLLVGEGVVDDLEGARLLVGEPGEDEVVGADRVQRARLQLAHALGVALGVHEGDAVDVELAVRRRVGDAAEGVGPGRLAQPLALEVRGLLDVVVVGVDHRVL